MSSQGRNRRIREFKQRKLFAASYGVGQATAENGGTLDDCPYGACEEPTFENHKNARIAGFGFGYFEVLIEREMTKYRDLAFDAMVAFVLREQVPMIPAPQNPRSKNAFLTRFEELMGSSTVAVEWVEVVK